jgi:MoaA/NifB/PqqE/SkfB family radical SAM enzyme
MKTQVAYSQRNLNAIDLSDAIPLPKPFTLAMELSGICNFKCVFCPVSTDDWQNSKRAGHMTVENFDKIIASLKDWEGPKIKAILLHGVGESLLNPNFTYMISQSFSSVCERSTLATNASLLKGDNAQALLESDLTYLKVSISATTQEKHKNITQSNIDINEIYENVAAFKSKRDSFGKGPYIYIKIISSILDKKEIDTFYEKYESVADEISMESMGNWNGRENFIKKNNAEPIQYTGTQVVCFEPFCKMFVRNNGDINLCPSDYMASSVFGNIAECTLKEIWLSTDVLNYQNQFLCGNQKQFLQCVNCNCYKTRKGIDTIPANIDSLTSEEFLSRIKKKGYSL